MPEIDLKLAELTFQEIEVGRSAEFRFRIEEEDVAAFARLSGDYSPLHIDEQFARRTRFRGRVAHGMLVAAPVSALVGMCLPGRHATLVGLQIRMVGPARIGDELVIRGEVKAVSEATHAIVVGFSITDERTAKTIIRGEAQVLVNDPPRRGISMSEIQALDLGMSFEGRVVLVTGASRGIGEATAKLFAHHGAKVAVNYLRGADDAEHIVAEILEAGGEAMAIAADVASGDDVTRMVREIADRFGNVHILVNNAVGDFSPTAFAEISWEDMQRDIDIVVKGAFNCIKAVLAGMIEDDFGRIVNVSTIYTSAPPPKMTGYVTAKSALVGLTRSLGAELGAANVLVNVVSAGMAETDLIAHVPEHVRKSTGASVPVGRLAQPIDVAKAILFLASPYADYVNGHELVVSGGSLLR